MLQFLAIALFQFSSIAPATTAETPVSSYTINASAEVVSLGGVGGWGNDVAALGGVGGWGNDVAA